MADQAPKFSATEKKHLQHHGYAVGDSVAVYQGALNDKSGGKGLHRVEVSKHGQGYSVKGTHHIQTSKEKTFADKQNVSWKTALGQVEGSSAKKPLRLKAASKPKPKAKASASTPKESGPMKTPKEHLESLPHMGDRSWDRDWSTGQVKDNRHIQEWGEGKKKTAAVDFRNHDYFTDRAGEEDDDHPHFTGGDRVVEQVKRHIGNDAKHYNVRAYPQEKGYFTVQIDHKTPEQKHFEKHGPKKGNLVTHAKTGETYHIRDIANGGRHIVTDIKRGNSTHIGARVPTHELKGYEHLKDHFDKLDAKAKAAHEKRMAGVNSKIKKSLNGLVSDAVNVLNKLKK